MSFPVNCNTNAGNVIQTKHFKCFLIHKEHAFCQPNTLDVCD